jgi:hypothetical protein
MINLLITSVPKLAGTACVVDHRFLMEKVLGFLLGGDIVNVAHFTYDFHMMMIDW